MKKNAFLTFLFACVPGCGAMYQGYMKRGVSLLFWFIALISLGAVLNFAAVAVLCIVVWAYSFFDTFNIRNLTPAQQYNFHDDYIPSRRWMEQNNLSRFVQPGRSAKYLGIALVIFGVVVVYNNVFNSISWRVYDQFPLLYSTLRAIPTFAIALGVIMLGVWMIRRSAKAPASPPEEDIVPFGAAQTPPQAPALTPLPTFQPTPEPFAPPAVPVETAVPNAAAEAQPVEAEAVIVLQASEAPAPDEVPLPDTAVPQMEAPQEETEEQETQYDVQ